MATIKKAQLGRAVSKILSKKSSGLVNDIVRKPAGMTNKPFKFTPVFLTDAQKASNAAILNNPGKATAKSWANAKKIASKESSQDAKNMATGKTRNQVSLEKSNAPFLKNLNETSISALGKRAQNIKKSAAPRRKNGGSIAKNGTTTTAQTTKKPIPTGILPYKAEVPGSRRPYTNEQKDSLINSWETKLKKESDKLLKRKNGGTVKAKDGKWIQKAVNPAHKGYCTPMTKATCTPRRKALAKTFKAMAKKRKSK